MGPLKKQELTHKEIERWYRLRNLRNAAQVFVVIAIVILVAGYALSRIIIQRQSPTAKDTYPKKINIISKPSYSFPGPHPFDIKAEEAQVSEFQDNIILQSPKITYRPKRGGEMVLTAKTGELNRTTQNYSVRGDVQITYDTIQIDAGQLDYSHKNNLASTTSNFTIKAKDMHLKGKQLKLWPEKKEAHIEQGVQATLFNVKIFNNKNNSPTQDKKKRP